VYNKKVHKCLVCQWACGIVQLFALRREEEEASGRRSKRCVVHNLWAKPSWLFLNEISPLSYSPFKLPISNFLCDQTDMLKIPGVCLLYLNQMLEFFTCPVWALKSVSVSLVPLWPTISVMFWIFQKDFIVGWQSNKLTV
jgi:hypothetical protein